MLSYRLGTVNDFHLFSVGCEYGDQDRSCAHYFPDDLTQADPSMCYTGTNEQICCENCAKYKTNVTGKQP